MTFALVGYLAGLIVGAGIGIGLASPKARVLR